MSRLTRAALVLIVPILAGCSGAAMDNATAQLVRQLGDPDQGRELIIRTGCGSCHEIPSVLGADGLVGPPLQKIARRQYIAGVLRNTPDNMVHWLRFPQQVVPGNAMPDLGLSEADARQIAAYLYTLS
jgi:cytochrome c2